MADGEVDNGGHNISETLDGAGAVDLTDDDSERDDDGIQA